VAVAIVALWIAFLFWIMALFRRNSNAFSEPKPIDTPAPNPGFERVVVTIFGVGVLILMASAAVFGFVVGVKGIAGILMGKYANHFYFACFFYLALLVGAFFCSMVVFQKVRYIASNHSWW
jgi:hypothetical protein